MKKYILYFIGFSIIVMHCFIKTEASEIALQNEQKYGVYDIIGRAIAPFKSGYGYSKEDKEKAHLEIARLEQEKINLEQQYKKDLSESFGAHLEQSIKDQFKKNMAVLDNQIYQQKIITGEVMSTKRKLFWAGVGITAATIGGMIIYKYFTKEPQKKVEPKKEPVIKPKKEPVVEFKKEPLKKFEFPPYQSPPLVDNPYDLKALENRLYLILQQKEVRNEKGLLVQNPNYSVTDEQKARQAVEKAKQLIKDFGYKYVSPPVIKDEADLKGHKERLKLIQDQLYVNVEGILRKNPLYNLSEELAEKDAVRKAQAIYDQATFKIPPAVTDEFDVEGLTERYNDIASQKEFPLQFNNQVELARNPFYDPGVAYRALEDVKRAKRKLEDEERVKEEELKKRKEELEKGWHDKVISELKQILLPYYYMEIPQK